MFPREGLHRRVRRPLQQSELDLLISSRENFFASLFLPQTAVVEERLLLQAGAMSCFTQQCEPRTRRIRARVG
jgi:hypothetical protein